MSIPMQLLLVIAAFCVCLSEGAPDGRITRAKQQRPTRGFKNLEMMTARGFGKRGRPSPRTERDVEDQALLERTNRGSFKTSSLSFGGGYGKRTPEMEPEGNLEDQSILERINRAPPTFKPPSVIFARGVGKRRQEMKLEVYGLDNFWEMLPGSPEREGQEIDDEKLESIPMDWFVNEIVNNPDFARSVVRKFIDINQDGMLSSDELLRNV